MKSSQFNDTQIIESWSLNAQPWITAVREGKVESRKQVTDQAIVNAILDCHPGSVLDVGCGEGWLARELSSKGIQVIGTDIVPELVDEARRAGGGVFHTLSYEEIAAGKLTIGVDAAVCNFSLIGNESVTELFKSIPSLLNSRGKFFVQTLHPVVACGDLPYRDGWREGSWTGFSGDFSNPAPWFFRTLESWIDLFVANRFHIDKILEPTHPKTQKPISVILVGETSDR